MSGGSKTGESQVKPKVAVIGYGPSGILTAPSIAEEADVTVLERASIMGGQWNFMEDGLMEPEPRHSR